MWRTPRPAVIPILMLLCGVTGAFSQQYLISTVAGGSPPPTPAPAMSLSVYPPAAIVSDSAGSLYFASANCIFRLDRDGVLWRVAGDSRRGFKGDGGPAIDAQLAQPTALALDGMGNLLVADSGNHRVRRITPDGVITTVAGSGRWPNFGSAGDGGPAVEADVSYPQGLAVDEEGNLYISDLQRIRKLTPDGVIHAFAGGHWDLPDGDGPAASVKLENAAGLLVDKEGSVYVAHRTEHRVRKISKDGMVTTIAGGKGKGFSGDGGPAVEAQLAEPQSLAFDGIGNLLIVDGSNFRVRRISADGVITTVAGGGKRFPGDAVQATEAELFQPRAVAVDGDGTVYVAAGWVQKIGHDGRISIVSGNGTYSYSGDGAAAKSAQLYGPAHLAVDAQGNLFLNDSGNLMIRWVDRAGVIRRLAGTGKFGFSGDGGPASLAEFGAISGLAVDRSGNLFISDGLNHRIRKISTDGMITTVVGDGVPGYEGDGGPGVKARINSPLGLAVDAEGNLFIADASNARVRKLTWDGVISTVAGTGIRGFSGDGGPAREAQLAVPRDLAVDASGNLFIVDGVNLRIRKVNAGGVISTFAGNGSGNISVDGVMAATAAILPFAGLATDTEGNFYFGEPAPFAMRVRRVSPDGILTTIAGGSTSADDGVPATKAYLAAVGGLATASTGRIYVSDSVGSVRLLEPVQ